MNKLKAEPRLLQINGIEITFVGESEVEFNNSLI